VDAFATCDFNFRTRKYAQCGPRLNNIVAETNNHALVSISIAAVQLGLCDVAATTTVSFYTSPVTREKYPALAK